MVEIDEALLLVATHFRDVQDADGEPYVMHCLRVMMGVEDPRAQVAALLHDIVEDTGVTLEDLTEKGFSTEVVSAVDLLTHRDAVSYAEYVVELKENPLARQVKLSDLRDNFSPRRVLYRADRRKRDIERMERYVLSYQFLSDQITAEEYRTRMASIGMNERCQD